MRLPVTLRYHGHGVLQTDDLVYARHSFGDSSRNSFYLSTKYRRCLYRRVEHAVHRDINTEVRRTVYLGRYIEAR